MISSTHERAFHDGHKQKKRETKKDELIWQEEKKER